MAKAVGWVVAAVALAVAVSLYFWGAGHRQRASDLEDRLAAAARNNAALKQTLEQMGEQVSEAIAEVRALEERVERLPGRDVSASDGLAEEPGDITGGALEAMMQALQGPPEGEDDQENPLMAMFRGERGKSVARMSAQMSLPAMYGGLFKDLDLPSETEAKVRELLIDHMAEDMSRGFEVMGKDPDFDEMRRQREVRGQQLRNDLATVLTADELAVFDAYEADKGRRMLESSLDIQLGMFASGLSEENRNMFRDVLLEEMTAEGDWFMEPETYARPEAAMDRQLEAFRMARERVVPAMEADQLVHVDAFVEQMESVMNAQRQFTETFMGRGREE